MLTILDDRPDDRVVGFRVRGRVTEEEVERATAHMKRLIDRHGKIRVLVHLIELGGIEPGALLDDFTFAVRHIRDFERWAAVGDQGWLRPWVKTTSLLIPGESEVFRSDDLEEAWGWLEEGL